MRIIRVRPDAPAIGASSATFVLGLNQGEVARVLCARMTLSTDATVAARSVVISARENVVAGFAYAALAPKTVAASQLANFTFGVTADAAGVAAFGEAPSGVMPYAVFDRDLVVQFTLNNSQVGDQMSSFEIIAVAGTLEEVAF